jgi:uncharacterized protein (TIGR00369 family)
VPRRVPETADLEVLRAAFRDFVPHNKAVGIELVEASFSPAVAILSLPFDARLVGNPESGHFHGGVITTLLDATCGASVFLKLNAPTPIATLDLRIDYLRPAPAHEAVYCRARCTKVTRHVAFAQAVAYHDDADDPMATVSATFMIFGGDKSVAMRHGKQQGGGVS